MAAAARTAKAVGGAVTRFFEGTYELKTGLPADAVSGLEDRLKVHDGSCSICLAPFKISNLERVEELLGT